MLRPERMSQAKILFLKNDSELVMDTLNSHGSFHLAIKEAEMPVSGLSDQVRDLLGKLKDVTSRADTLVAGVPSEGQGRDEPPLEAGDWPSFISLLYEEINSFETEIIRIETDISKDSKTRPIFELWKSYATANEGRISLGYLDSFRRLTPLILYGQGETIADLTPALPESSLTFNIASQPRIILILCLQGDKTRVIQSASEKGYSLLKPLEGMPADYASMGQYLESYASSLKIYDEGLMASRKSIASRMPRLHYLNSLLSDAYSVLTIKEKSSLEKRWQVLEGYVPSKLADSLVSDLNMALNGRMISFVQEEHSSPKVPVTYKYPRYFKPFATVTHLYGVPNYNEVNPTPILALSFPLIFGFMFGDIGQGLMLSALGFIFYKYTKSLSKIGLYLIICGIFGCLMGAILYGEAFGIHIYPGLLTPVGVIEDIMIVFAFALAVGVFQISLGMVMRIANNLIQKKKADAFLMEAPRLAFYLVSIYVIIAYGINFANWLGGPIYFILVPLLIFLLGKPVYKMVTQGIHEGLSSLGEMGFETFDTIIRFISNSVSYLRIFALVIAHAMLTSIFYILGALFGGGIVGILLAVVGNIFVVLLEGIIALAQDLRLHFYEWFSRFYDDGGILFSPFKLRTKIPVLRR